MAIIINHYPENKYIHQQGVGDNAAVEAPGAPRGSERGYPDLDPDPGQSVPLLSRQGSGSTSFDRPLSRDFRSESQELRRTGQVHCGGPPPPHPRRVRVAGGRGVDGAAQARGGVGARGRGLAFVSKGGRHARGGGACLASTASPSEGHR